MYLLRTMEFVQKLKLSLERFSRSWIKSLLGHSDSSHCTIEIMEKRFFILWENCYLRMF